MKTPKQKRIGAWAVILAISLATGAVAAEQNYLAHLQAALSEAEIGDDLPRPPFYIRDRGRWEVQVAEGAEPAERAIRMRRAEPGSLRLSMNPSPRELEGGAVYEFSAWLKSRHPGATARLQYQTSVAGLPLRYSEVFSPTDEYQRFAFQFEIPGTPGMEAAARGNVQIHPGHRDREADVEILVARLSLRRADEPDDYIGAPAYGTDPDPVQGLDAFMERQGVKPYDLFERDGELATLRVIFRDRQFGTPVWMLDNSPAADHCGTASVWSAWNPNASTIHLGGRRPVGGSIHRGWFFNADFSRMRPAQGGRPAVWSPEDSDVYYEPISPSDRIYRTNARTGEREVVAELVRQRGGKRLYGLTKDGRHAFIDMPNRGIFVPFEYDPEHPIPRLALYDGRPVGPGGRPIGHNRVNVVYGHEEHGDLIALRTGALVDLETGESIFIAAPLCGNENYLRAFHEDRVRYPEGDEWAEYGLPAFARNVRLPRGLSMEELYDLWLNIPHATHGHESHSPDRTFFARDGSPNIYRLRDGKERSVGLGGNYHLHWRQHPRYFVAWVRGWGFRNYLRRENANIEFQVFCDATAQPIVDTKHNFNGYYGGGDFSMFSPDATKIHYASSMTGNFRNYIAVAVRPRPPRRLSWRADGAAVALSWEPSLYNRETRGYLVYRSERSGDGYALMTPDPIQGTSWRDTTVRPGQGYYYVATSLEHSGLESRYSEEAARVGVGLPANLDAPLAAYAEAEDAVRYLPTGDLPGLAMGADRFGASDWFYLYRHPEADHGEAEVEVNVPADGRYHVWARVRSAGGERTDWNLSLSGRTLAIRTDAPEWTWIRAGRGPVALSAGRTAVRLATSDAAAQMDLLCLATDAGFAPVGPRPEGTTPPPAPENLRAENARERVNRLAWERPDAPSLSHYQVYASREAGFEVGQETLVGSPTYEEFIDWGLRAGAEYHYAVTAVDRRGNESAPARVSQATPPAEHPPFELELAFAEAELEGPFERSEAGGLRGPAFVVPEEPDANRAVWRVEIPREGEYYLWLRSLLRGTGARGRQARQSVNVRVNGRRVAQLGAQTDLHVADELIAEGHPLAPHVWTWDRPGPWPNFVNVEATPLPAGEVELALDGLAPNMRYDVLLITDEPSFFPQDGRLRGN